jgi:hypothetical protein
VPGDLHRPGLSHDHLLVRISMIWAAS